MTIRALKFYADWCGPCEALNPTWNSIKTAFEGGVLFEDINIDNDPQLRAEFFVRTIPTIVLVKDGVEVARRIGGGTFSELESWLDEQGLD